MRMVPSVREGHRHDRILESAIEESGEALLKLLLRREMDLEVPGGDLDAVALQHAARVALEFGSEAVVDPQLVQELGETHSEDDT
jgi:hypothetical protein